MTPCTSALASDDLAVALGPANPKLLMPRISPKEVRSYQFFLEVTAPALAGSFDAEFWCRDLPKVCVADPALWHSIVTLGAVHEAYGQKEMNSEARNLFALQQYSAAIRCLVESKSPRHADRWRALTVSAVFTCVCIMQGLHQQMYVHLAAGCNIIRELQDEEKTKHPRPMTRDQHIGMSSIPINLHPVRNILFQFEIMAQAMGEGGCSSQHHLDILAQSDNFGFWRSYRTPRVPTETPRLGMRENIIEACRAAESLLNGIALWGQENVTDIGALYLGQSSLVMYDVLISKQAALVKCYRELLKSLSNFQKEMVSDVPQGVDRQIRMLDLMLATARLLFLSDPDIPDMAERAARTPELCEKILDLCESLIESDEACQLGGSKIAISSNSQTMHPLFSVAHGGYSHATRERALALMRKPRLEGLWETGMNASLAEAMWTREMVVTQEHLDRQRIFGENKVKNHVGPGFQIITGGSAPPHFRCQSVRMAFTGKREARLILQTWAEANSGFPGVEQTISW